MVQRNGEKFDIHEVHLFGRLLPCIQAKNEQW
jgi:hypothetical protein